MKDTAVHTGWVSRLLRAGMVLIFLVAALELFIRLFVFPDWRDLSPQILKPHPVFLRFSAPDLSVRQYDPPNFDVLIETNSLGFRDRRDGFDEDLAGLWLCGGSNVFGTGVNNDETMAAQIERFGYRVANIAAEGSQIEIEARVIRYLIREGFRPKAVICAITTPGAIYDTVEKGWLQQFDAPLPDADAVAKPVADIRSAADRLWFAVNSVVPITEDGTAFSVLAAKARLVKSSAIYGALKYGVGEIPALYDWLRQRGYIADSDLHISGEADLYLKDLPAMQVARVANMGRFLVRVRDLVQDQLGVPFGIVLVPTQHQVYPAKFARYLAHNGLNPTDYDLSLPNRRMEEMLSAYGIPSLDLRAPLLARNDEALTFINNGHLNPRGQEVAAETIAPWIASTLGIEAAKP
ncbi:MAG: hypothetical protein RIC36_20015 [Rhodospirillales bacterium]